MTPRALRILGTLALLVLGFSYLYRIPVFLVRLPESRPHVFHLERVSTGDEIVLTYRHSVEKTQVKGIFRVSAAPCLQAAETWMTSVGTGLPNTSSGRTRIQGEWIVVDEGLKEIENFRFFVSSVNQARMDTPSGGLELTVLPSGTIIEPVVEKMPVLMYAGYRIVAVIRQLNFLDD
ncbi:MAG: DUF1850 domain-containing protein [Desulfotignum sp.]